MPGWADAISEHRFRSLMAPIAWDDGWLSSLTVTAPPSSPEIRAFLDAAHSLRDSYRDEGQRFSLRGCLSGEMSDLPRQWVFLLGGSH